MGEGSWRGFVDPAEAERAGRAELTNEIDFVDISSSLDGYGWQPDRKLATKLGLSLNDDIDPICCLVLEGMSSYLELCGGSEPEELHFELDHALRPLDVIKDSHGWATRFTLLNALRPVAEDVLDYLVWFYFPSRGFGITVELFDDQLDYSGQSLANTVMFRLNKWKIGKGISASSLVEIDQLERVSLWKVHNLAANGTLIQLKTRGDLLCPFCSKLSQIRVTVETADAISAWQFNPTEANHKRAFAKLTDSEREVLMSGIHEECWP